VTPRYAQVNHAGLTSVGVALGTLRRLADGRLRLVERWESESLPGSGASTLEEVDALSEPVAFATTGR
jgi:hypothetical protein